MAQFDVNTITLDIQQKQCDVLEFYASNTGGAVTLLEAVVVNNATTESNTSFRVALKKYSSAGTPVVVGTVFGAVGGTQDHWTSNVPKAMTLNDDIAVIESGEWVGLCMTQQNNGTPTNGKVILHYVGGKV
jgi:hypothetical protein